MGNQFLKGLQRPAIMPEGSSLPDYSEANEGDVLQIQGNEPVWGAVEALPEIEETDEGKVLSVDQGEAVWTEPSGGSGYDIQTEITFTFSPMTGQIADASVTYADLLAELETWYDPTTNPQNAKRYYAKVNLDAGEYGTQSFVADASYVRASEDADYTITLLDATPIVLSAANASIQGTTASWVHSAVRLYGWSADRLPILGATSITITGTAYSA